MDEAGSKGFSIWFESYELDSVNGSLDLKIILHALDTIKLGDKLVLYATGFSTDVVTVVNTKDSLVFGDTIIFNLKLNYNTDSIPFYPMDINLTLLDSQTGYGVNGTYHKQIKVFFTPWNSIELWNLTDFHALKRVWIADNKIPMTRIFIDKDSLPTTDITGDTLLSDSGTFYIRKIKGLAFAIPFNQPDSFGHDSIMENDAPSSIYRANGCGWGRKEFTGRIADFRIYTWYNPSGNNPVKVWLKNAKVQLSVNRAPGAIIKECKTDNEGYVTDMGNNRSFNFDFCAGKGHTFKEVTLIISMCDPNNSNTLRVKDASSWQDFFVHVTPDIDLEYSSQHPVISGRLGTQVGTWWEYGLPVDHYGLLYTQLGWAKEYSNNELAGTDMQVTQNLAVKIEEDKWIQDQSEVAHYNPVNRTIHLGKDRYTNEGTVFHEYGHHFFRHIYGNWDYPGNNTHYGTWNNVHSKMTMGEGMADAFSAIMDEMTWNILGFKSDQRFNHRPPFFNHSNKSTGEALRRLDAPILSEEYVAATVLDLWDGVNNYAKFNNTNTDGPNLDDLVSDNFEMPFKEICLIFWNNKGNLDNIYSFYDKLLWQTECNQRSSIRSIFQFNASDIQSGLDPSNFPVFSTDDIDIPQSISVVGYNIKKTAPEGGGSRPSEYDEKPFDFNFNKNIDIMNGTLNNYNMAYFQRVVNGGPPIEQKSLYQNISDDLTLINGAQIEFNSTNDPEFYNNSAPQPPGSSFVFPASTLAVNVCKSTDISLIASKMILGDAIDRYAIVTFGNETSLKTENNSIITINNNSKLVIELGATFEYYPNTQIILNGDNAVLEIRGELKLMNGAVFSVQGGAQGFGHVAFYRDWHPIDPPQLVTGHGSVVLNGNGKTDKILEIDGNAGLVIFSNQFERFEVSNGKIEMGSNSTLLPQATKMFKMNNVSIVPKTTNVWHGGIHVWGCGDNDFTDVSISRAWVGFRNYPITWDRYNRIMPCRTPLKLTNVDIDDCYVGVRSEGNDVEFRTVNITNIIDAGWEAWGVSLRSKVYNSNISPQSSTTNAYGIKRHGSGQLWIRNTKIHDSRHGVYAEEGIVSPKCSEIYNIAGSGLWLEGNTVLDMGDGASNKLRNNAAQHILSRYKGTIIAKNGYNVFSTPTGGTVTGYWASLAPNQPYTTVPTVFPGVATVDFDYNYFGNANKVTLTPITAPNPPAPVTPYYLFHDNNTLFQYYHTMQITNGYNTLSAANNAANSNCPSLTPMIRPDDDLGDLVVNWNNRYDQNANFAIIPTLTSTWGTSNLHNNYAQLALIFSDSNANPINLLNKATEILSLNFTGLSSPPRLLDASLKDLYNTAYRAYSFGFNKYTAKPDSIDNASLDTLNQQFINLSNVLKTKANNEIAPWSDMHYQLAVDKSNVYRLNADFTNALSTLNSVYSIVDSLDLPYLQRWICINQSEQYVRYDTSALDSNFTLNYPCYGMFIGNALPPDTSSSLVGATTNLNNANASKEKVRLYPNPTSQGFFIEGLENLQLEKVYVYDVTGKQLKVPMTVTNEKLLYIDTKNLLAGVYLVSYEASTKEKVEFKVMVIK